MNWGQFTEWLTACGAEVLTPTNEYEVARWRDASGTSIIYRAKGARLTCTGSARSVLADFRAGKNPRLAPATRRKKSVPVDVRTILERDGHGCFYCGRPFSDDDPATIEHLVALTHRGPNHLSNKFLAHERCNTAAGVMSAPEKIAMRDRIRSESTMGGK